MKPPSANHPVPIQFHDALFPQPGISVSQFLGFNFPSQDPGASTAPPFPFFARKAPIVVSTSDLQLLRTLPIPSQSTIDALSNYLTTLVTDEPVSIVYAHLPIDNAFHSVNFPSWVIPYWLWISRLRRHVVLPWQRAEQWLANSLSYTGHRDLVADARSILHHLPWTGTTWAFSDPKPITSLTRYLSSNWFGTTHIDQQLDLLRHRLTRKSPIHEFEILPTHFIRLLLELHQDYQTNYTGNQRFRHIWARGEELSAPKCQQMRIGGVVNVNGNHWVAVVVDLRSSTILYGDSLNLSDSIVVPTLSWWTQFHTGHQFSTAVLPIGTQSDNVSCGVFALGALIHHFFPELVIVGQCTIRMERLHSFCATGQLELDAVSYCHHNPGYLLIFLSSDLILTSRFLRSM